jgi:hypothetical protein
MSHKPYMKKQLPEKDCKNCKESFVPYRKIQDFCSPSCRGQYYWKTHTVVEIEPELEPVLSSITNETKTS